MLWFSYWARVTKDAHLAGPRAALSILLIFTVLILKVRLDLYHSVVRAFLKITVIGAVNESGLVFGYDG